MSLCLYKDSHQTKAYMQIPKANRRKSDNVQNINLHMSGTTYLWDRQETRRALTFHFKEAWLLLSTTV